MFSDLDPTPYLDLLGTFAFAISGIRLASRKHFDWFGAYVIGFATAIGGGTVRDLLLDLPPIWLTDPRYLVITGLALLVTILFRSGSAKWVSTLFLFDAIGLGLFTVTGITRSLAMDLPVWTCIIMGTISGSVGGVIRDVLINELPLIFRKDLYATACVLGGVVYFGGLQLPFLAPFHGPLAALAVILVRVLAVRYQLGLPRLKGP
jgi:uncharacterized membrane protein YeiH